MSTYAINRMLWSFGREPSLVQHFRANEDEVFDQFGVDAEERALIRSHDVMALYERGVLPNCLMKLGGAYGVSVHKLFDQAAARQKEG